MRIILNGKETNTDSNTAFSLRNSNEDDDEVVIINGFKIDVDRKIREGDQIHIIKKGIIPNKNELEAMISARHTPGVYDKLKNGKVAVAGLGGLGSNIAVMLARVGVGSLLLVDFDLVEPSNLNRQHYMTSHLAMPKTLALKNQIADINPLVRTEIRDIRINAQNAVDVFRGYPIVAEAFDNPVCKAELIESLLQTGDTKIVAASGMAGFDSANLIQTRRRLKNLYLCGDLETEACEGTGLMAPRVAVCAGHQANMIMRLLLELEEV